jgi:glutamate formiminotransferase
VADWSADEDHNRVVVTFVATPKQAINASLAAVATALELIDLNRHIGVHPRMGALDVLPFVPLRGITLAECAELAVLVGQTVSQTLDIPVFLYENASRKQRSLPDIRKNAFHGIMPDFGPLQPHPTFGALVCGSRRPLIAFNVNLLESDVRTARRIAKEIREEFPGEVRALGLYLQSRNLAQVSTNIIRPERVSPLEVIQFVAERADVISTELIGALPGWTALSVLRDALGADSLLPGQVLLESWGEPIASG